MMKQFKYISLGIIITLAVLFFFLNRDEVLISFLFADVQTKVSSAIAVAFILGVLTGALLMLLRKSSPTVVESTQPEEDIRGIDLRK